MTVNDIDGSTFTGADVRGMGQIKQIDETTDFDMAASGTSLTDTANKTYTITAAELGNADYVVVEILGKFQARTNGVGSGSQSASVTVKIEDVTGAPSTLIERTVAATFGTDENTADTTNIFKHYVTVTGAHSTQIDLKITISAATPTNGNGSFEFTNDQIVLSTGY